MRRLAYLFISVAFLFLSLNVTMGMFSFFKKITVLKSQLRPSLYDYEVQKLDGTTVPMSLYKNKVLLIFNSASKCGLTKNHVKEFNDLYERLHGKGLEILAFPTRQFLNQEFQNSCDIRAFNEQKNIKYEVFAPVEVNGDNTHELFKYLKANCDTMHNKDGTLENIGWNFGKFLINKEGQVVAYFSPRINPLDLENHIMQLL
ncbi:glutathione peroxidase-like thioredoxin peroxidase, putative [Plasmodium ovale]|uniref:Glutathione peroxidase n=2 Tax=Plasmodium ovale TaxID=36330 RepID=A0A1C3KWV9_PLAOA|nr:glutathione peroxidase-like thioredoxin peroxidase, putative [Plasmodium ovale]